MSNFIQRISKFSFVIKTFQIIQYLVPLALTAWTFISTGAERLPLAVLIALSTLTLASSLILINQLRQLLNVPIVVSPKNDLRYAISYTGLMIALNADPINGGLQLGVFFDNCLEIPLEYEVERMDFVVGTTTLPKTKNISTIGVIPARKGRSYKDESIPSASMSNMFNSIQNGTLELHLAYGKLDSVKTRRLKMKFLVTYHIGPNIPTGITGVISDEVEEAIKA